MFLDDPGCSSWRNFGGECGQILFKSQRCLKGGTMGNKVAFQFMDRRRATRARCSCTEGRWRFTEGHGLSRILKRWSPKKRWRDILGRGCSKWKGTGG